MHIAGTYDGTLFKIHVNGFLARSSQFVVPGLQPATNIGSPILIGKDGSGATTNWLGLIDEVRIWSYALTTDEIQSRMMTKLGGRERGLIGYWNFDEGNGTDSSIYANHGKLHGDVPIVSSTLALQEPPRFLGGRLSVNGGFQLLLDGTAGTEYLVQATTNFYVWEDVASGRLENPPVQVSDFSAGSWPRRIYRAITISTP